MYCNFDKLNYLVKVIMTKTYLREEGTFKKPNIWNDFFGLKKNLVRYTLYYQRTCFE